MTRRIAASKESWCSADRGECKASPIFCFAIGRRQASKTSPKKAGVSDPKHHYGLGVVWGDYDNDGWPDLYVANDAGPNYLYRNKHDGTFEDTAMLAGAASAETVSNRVRWAWIWATI